MKNFDLAAVPLAVLVVAASFFGAFGCGGSGFQLGEEIVNDDADTGDTGSTEETSETSAPDALDTDSLTDAPDAGSDSGLPPSDSGVLTDSSPPPTDTAPPPPTHKRIFTTSETYTAVMGGLAGADAKCQALANASSLTSSSPSGGVYKAWLSDSKTSAKTRLTHSALPYVLVDGTKIADNWADLVTGALAHAIDKTEKGGVPPTAFTNPDGSPSVGYENVWTATEISGAFHDYASSGTKTSTCLDWTSLTDADGGPYALAGIGKWNVAGAAWTDYTTSSCQWGSPPKAFKTALYCLEQ